jgi:hypothetical protein
LIAYAYLLRSVRLHVWTWEPGQHDARVARGRCGLTGNIMGHVVTHSQENGRPLKTSDDQRREALQRMDAGESVVDLARTFGADRATRYRMQALASALEGE